MNITEIVRRSSLIMPVNQPRFVDKAYLRGADAIVLDLEDSVPPAEKGRARTMVKEAIPVAARGGADVFVRINKPVEMMVEDLEAAIHPGLTGLALPRWRVRLRSICWTN
jgi:citrate lyase subunit beta/citryl-CoA lyase